MSKIYDQYRTINLLTLYQEEWKVRLKLYCQKISLVWEEHGYIRPNTGVNNSY